MSRTAEITRNTKETQIKVRLDLDGTGVSEISTGIGFFDHMLESFSRHGGIDLFVETKGYRREDAKENKETLETYWVPGVNNAARYGRWAFEEFTDVYQIQSDFAKKVESEFEKMIERVAGAAAQGKPV